MICTQEDIERYFIHLMILEENSKYYGQFMQIGASITHSPLILVMCIPAFFLK